MTTKFRTKGKGRNRKVYPVSGKPKRQMTVASALTIHQMRPTRAQAIDNKMKAGLASSPDEWAKQPNRSDLKGVDYNPYGYTPHNIPSQKVKPATVDNRASGVASYNTATGWMRVTFDEKPDRETLDGLKARGFRYKPRSRAWSAKWTPEREDHAKTLVKDWQTVDIKPNWATKAERAEASAEKHTQTANETHDRFRKELDTIPMGQPILVGHHSEKGHRAHLKRLDNMMEKTIKEQEIAKEQMRKANRYRRKAVGEPPGVIYRRIQKLEANRRKMKSQLYGDVFIMDGKYYRRKGSEPSEERKQEIQKWIKHYDERLKIEREKYNASGGIFTDKVKLKKGDMIRTQVGTVTVKKVNPKTVTVETGHGWDLKLDNSQIYGKIELEN